MQGNAGQFPCRNVDFIAQMALERVFRPSHCGGERVGICRSERRARVAIVGLAMGRHRRRDGPGKPARSRHDPGQRVAVARGEGLPARLTPGAIASGPTPTSRPRRAIAGLQVIDLSGLPGTRDARNDAVGHGLASTRPTSRTSTTRQRGVAGCARPSCISRAATWKGGAWRAYSLANPAQPQLVATGTARHGIRARRDEPADHGRSARRNAGSATIPARSTSTSTRTRWISGT